MFRWEQYLRRKRHLNRLKRNDWNELDKRTWRKGKKAEKIIGTASTKIKNDALLAIAQAIKEKAQLIMAQNSIDIKNAIKNDMSVSMQDRLLLNEARIKSIADAVLQIAKLEDPIGAPVGGTVRPNGLRITKIRVPIGTIGIIYESRPNVTVDAAALLP